MKTKVLLMFAAAAAIVVGCKGKSEEEKLAEYNQWNADFMEQYQAKAVELAEDQEALEAYADSAINVYLEYTKAAVEANLDNQVAVAAVQNLYGLVETEEVIAYIEQIKAPVHGQDSAFFATLLKSATALKTTAEGQMFTDFEVDGQKFSDYIGKGKYVLVDFWASWCGPCRREMPNLRAVYEEFHGEQFDMLSVAVWDKPEDTAKAAEEENIAWNQIVNAQQVPTDLYGIEGIPHIILFGPDGTILKRNLRGENIRAAVAEALGK